ncbi:hypothetical protein ACL02T_12285 [Pseudonocardia sp. RS010]|uniref:hypothetical protein n=1 Tax=Pseudonocardia sp. RS010 TaxID=3385979 RepID=UPI0039A23A87
MPPATPSRPGPSGAARGSARTWRRLAVWVHLLSSVGWMTCALALFALLVPALRGGAPWAVEAAHHLDTRLLAPLANTSGATGLVLSLGTAWGLAVHRWVLTKLVITLVQLYLGIFVLSRALDTAADTLRVSPALVVGTALMAGAIAVQAWLSVAKPGGRTRWGTRGGRPVTLPTAPPWVFAVVVAAPVADVALSLLLGFPSPLCSIAAVVVGAVVRRRSLRRRSLRRRTLRRTRRGSAPA